MMKATSHQLPDRDISTTLTRYVQVANLLSNNNNDNNKDDNVYGAVIVAKPLREFWCRTFFYKSRHLNIKVCVPATALLMQLMTRSTLQSRKWQLIGIS